MEFNNEIILVGSTLLTIITQFIKDKIQKCVSKKISDKYCNLAVRVAMIVLAVVISAIYLLIKDTATFQNILTNGATIFAGASSIWLILIKSVKEFKANTEYKNPLND